MSLKKGVVLPNLPVIISNTRGGNNENIIKIQQCYEKAVAFLLSKALDTIIIITPHTSLYLDYFHISPGECAKGNLFDYGINDFTLDVNYDRVFAEELSKISLKNNIPAGMLGEKNACLDHGFSVPLTFIKNNCNFNKSIKFVRVGVSGLPLIEHYKLGMMIDKASQNLNRKIAVVASGNLSHRLNSTGKYGYSINGERYDKKIMDTLNDGNFAEIIHFSDVFCEKAGECGHRSLAVLAGCFDGYKVATDNLIYKAIYDTGCGICTVEKKEKDSNRCFFEQYEEQKIKRINHIRKNESEYARLARKATEEYVLNRRIMAVSKNSSDNLINRVAGVFISIVKDNLLRGCMGSVFPTTACIAQEIIRNSVMSAGFDYRFNPIRENELRDLIFSVDIVKNVEYIKSAKMLDIKKYGLIITRGMKQGILLPDTKGIDSVEEQIAVAKRKAGIADDLEVVMQRFETEKYV